MTEFTDMNGIWSGEYQYPSGRSVRFAAWFIDTGGVLTGTTLEPNTFAPLAGEELDAALNGTRTGRAILFEKLYSEATGIVQPPIRYDGEADAAFTLVTGSWSFASLYDLTGTFRLSRVATTGARAALRAALQPVSA